MAFKLKLLGKPRVFPIFNGNLLKYIKANIIPKDKWDWNQNKKFKIKKILNKKKENNIIIFLIKWKYYNKDENNWESK